MTDKFAVFILTYGRPHRMVTYNTLKKQGYTGDVYVIIDNEDKSAEEYKHRFGDKVIIFDKLAISREFDTGDNFDDRRAVVFARNASFRIANDLGLDYFLQLDDDYTSFCWKFSPSLQFQDRKVKDLDRLFAAVIRYYKSINALSIAFGQGGDLLGGRHANLLDSLQIKRKCMNTFFCSTSRPFEFVGRVNEDVNTYCTLGNRGSLMFSIFNVCITQVNTQSGGGGMTGLYLNEGTYRKSFYTVMYEPSFVQICGMGETHRRLHHKIKWEHAVPCILDEKWRKNPQRNQASLHKESIRGSA